MIRVRSVFSGVAGSPYYSNLFFDTNLSDGAQAAVDAVGVMWDAFSDVLATPMTIDIEAFVPTIAPQTGDITGGFTVTPPGRIQCTEISERLPPATQLCVNLRTNVYVAGREIKGKCYVPGWTTQQNSGVGNPENSAINFSQDRFNDLNATGPDLVVWSRKNGSIAPVSAAIAMTQWAVLRSRRD